MCSSRTITRVSTSLTYTRQCTFIYVTTRVIIDYRAFMGNYMLTMKVNTFMGGKIRPQPSKTHGTFSKHDIP